MFFKICLATILAVQTATAVPIFGGEPAKD